MKNRLLIMLMGLLLGSVFALAQAADGGDYGVVSVYDGLSHKNLPSFFMEDSTRAISPTIYNAERVVPQIGTNPYFLRYNNEYNNPGAANFVQSNTLASLREQEGLRVIEEGQIPGITSEEAFYTPAEITNAIGVVGMAGQLFPLRLETATLYEKVEGVLGMTAWIFGPSKSDKRFVNKRNSVGVVGLAAQLFG